MLIAIGEGFCPWTEPMRGGGMRHGALDEDGVCPGCGVVWHLISADTGNPYGFTARYAVGDGSRCTIISGYPFNRVPFHGPSIWFPGTQSGLFKSSRSIEYDLLEAFKPALPAGS